MKIRARKVLNFFAFNLLFFALYLNFIHKDKVVSVHQGIDPATAVVNGTIHVDNPESYLNNKTVPVSSEQTSMR
jgi:hypothetical protein